MSRLMSGLKSLLIFSLYFGHSLEGDTSALTRMSQPRTYRNVVHEYAERFTRTTDPMCYVDPSDVLIDLEDQKSEKSNITLLKCTFARGLNVTVDTTELEAENRVQVLNATTLMSFLADTFNENATKRIDDALCSVVIFYAPWCPFSARAAPHFNGLARLYPDIVFVATDANRNQGLTTSYGIIGFPTVIMFHNSRPILKFNLSVYELEYFSKFVTTLTGLKPIGVVAVTDEDNVGPMPTVWVPETDFNLYLSWAFIVFAALAYFGKTPFCQRIIENIRNNWQEVEIQHEHNE